MLSPESIARPQNNVAARDGPCCFDRPPFSELLGYTQCQCSLLVFNCAVNTNPFLPVDCGISYPNGMDLELSLSVAAFLGLENLPDAS